MDALGADTTLAEVAEAGRGGDDGAKADGIEDDGGPRVVEGGRQKDEHCENLTKSLAFYST